MTPQPGSWVYNHPVHWCPLCETYFVTGRARMDHHCVPLLSAPPVVSVAGGHLNLGDSHWCSRCGSFLREQDRSSDPLRRLLSSLPLYNI